MLAHIRNNRKSYFVRPYYEILKRTIHPSDFSFPDANKIFTFLAVRQNIKLPLIITRQ